MAAVIRGLGAPAEAARGAAARTARLNQRRDAQSRQGRKYPERHRAAAARFPGDPSCAHGGEAKCLIIRTRLLPLARAMGRACDESRHRDWCRRACHPDRSGDVNF